MKTMALFGGSFNPPGIHHLKMAEALTKHFDEVVVIPCGPRPDKEGVEKVSVQDRSEMVELTFGSLKKVRVDLFDLTNATFTRAVELDRRFSQFGEVWHVVGSDLLKGGKAGASPIQTSWKEGVKFWQTARFAVFLRPNEPLSSEDLPPCSKIIPIQVEGSSSEIRRRLALGDSAADLLPPTLLGKRCLVPFQLKR